MQDPIEDYLEKPFFLKDATHKIKRVVDRIALEKLTRAESTDGMLRGSLSQMNVIDLVQSLEMGRKSCLLTMTNGDDKCEIYFNQGQAKHAAYGPVQGRSGFQSAALDGWKLSDRFQRQVIAGNDNAEHAGPANGRIAAAGRGATRRLFRR